MQTSQLELPVSCGFSQFAGLPACCLEQLRLSLKSEGLLFEFG